MLLVHAPSSELPQRSLSVGMPFLQMPNRETGVASPPREAGCSGSGVDDRPWAANRREAPVNAGLAATLCGDIPEEAR